MLFRSNTSYRDAETKHALTGLDYAMGRDVEITVSEPGLEYTIVVKGADWVEKRTDCFCCSCSEDEWGHISPDVACRNHGFAGKRPCRAHNMPGSEYDPEMGGGMPDSVQKHRERNNPKSELPGVEAETL